MRLRDLVEHASAKFAEAQIDSAQNDAELLAAHVLGLSKGALQSTMIVDTEISELEAEQIANLYARRIAREPLQHITGKAYFRNLELSVGRGVFIPRPETEFVAQLAIDALRATANAAPTGIDLGTGSGAIALAMATEVPHARVFAVEKSDDALPFTKANFDKYAPTGAQLIQGDLADAFHELDGQVSVVASNPPYIPNAAIPRDVEVHLFDPALALYGGEDGLDVIRVVSKTAARLLVTGGVLIIEHADSQSEQVVELLLADGWRQVRAHQDLTGRDRAVSALR